MCKEFLTFEFLLSSSMSTSLERATRTCAYHMVHKYRVGKKFLAPPAISLPSEDPINHLMSGDVVFSPVQNDPLKMIC
jgi:hypothetical protein